MNYPKPQILAEIVQPGLVPSYITVPQYKFEITRDFTKSYEDTISVDGTTIFSSAGIEARRQARQDRRDARMEHRRARLEHRREIVARNKFNRSVADSTNNTLNDLIGDEPTMSQDEANQFIDTTTEAVLQIMKDNMGL